LDQAGDFKQTKYDILNIFHQLKNRM